MRTSASPIAHHCCRGHHQLLSLLQSSRTSDLTNCSSLLQSRRTSCLTNCASLLQSSRTSYHVADILWRLPLLLSLRATTAAISCGYVVLLHARFVFACVLWAQLVRGPQCLYAFSLRTNSIYDTFRGIVVFEQLRTRDIAPRKKILLRVYFNQV